MKTLSASACLAIWERGVGHHPARQALHLLNAAWPEVGPDMLAQLSLGQRNLLLLRLREQLFGSQIESVVGCPGCGQQVELTLDVRDIGGQPDQEFLEPKAPYFFSQGDYQIHFRLPNSLDLLAIGPDQEATIARNALLARCLVLAQQGDQTISSDQLPLEIEAQLIDQMAQADPQADIELAITCPFCTRAWQVGFDVIHYLWRELTAWAYRFLGDVHTLASEYGWAEGDILALSPWRRQAYLAMIRGT
jgi:hypothetical protein